VNSQLSVLGFLLGSGPFVLLAPGATRCLAGRFIHPTGFEGRAFLLSLEYIDLIFQPRNGFLQQNNARCVLLQYAQQRLDQRRLFLLGDIGHLRQILHALTTAQIPENASACPDLLRSYLSG